MATKTFLDLCTQLIEDAGISGTIASTVAQTGEFKRVVGWIRRATTEIEGMWFNWNFLHEFHSLNTIIGVRDYPPPSNLNMWDTSVLRLDEFEQNLIYRDWNVQKLDPSIPQNGDPYLFTILPAKTLRLYDTPMREQLMTGAYWRKATELVESLDEPSIPEQFRDVIVSKALTYYANYESADESKLSGIETLLPRLSQLRSSELPAHQNSESVNTGANIQIVAGSDFEDLM